MSPRVELGPTPTVPVVPVPSTPGTVLVIDDTDATRDGLLELLRLRGYSALGARDGAEGLTRLEEHPHVCVVVLDLAMPRTDGYWFRQRQLRHPLASAIPVIVFTGTAENSPAIEAFSGCEVLRKPFSVDRLFDAIEHCRETRLCGVTRPVMCNRV